jgi:RNA polymerase sigma-70 factor (ECF subfamily)
MPVDEIVQKCVEGDRRSQYQLFEAYGRRVHSVVYRMLGPKYDVDDVVQQVFIGLFESLPTFKGLSSLDTWVYRLCVKVCTDQLRKKYRKRVLNIVESDEGVDNAADGVTPLMDLERRELRGKIFEALEKLSAEKRTVLVLYEMEGKTIEEIAEIVRAPGGTVKSRLFHGRNDLQKHLRKYVVGQ